MTFRTRIRSIRASEPFWRYGSNLAPTLEHLIRPNKYRNDAVRTILEELDVRGVAIARVEDLLDAESLTEFYRSVDSLLLAKRVEIEELKANVDKDHTPGQKTFNLELLGSEPEFDADSVFPMIGLNATFLAIADGYLRMAAQLRYYNIWYTAASAGASRESQLWHFDREDNYILKAFLYLGDVDEGTGPFTYAPGTHRKGEHHLLQPDFILEGNVRRTTDDQMAKVFSRCDWKACTGEKGTIVFADTRGYHKGGEARTGDRMMFTCMYTSQASQSKDLIRFAGDFDPARLSRNQVRALRIPRT